MQSSNRKRRWLLALAAVSVVFSVGYGIRITLVPRSDAALASLLRQADPDARAQSLRRYLVGQPDDAAAWKALGLALVGAGRPGEAVSAYSQAAVLRPGDREIVGALESLARDLARRRE